MAEIKIVNMGEIEGTEFSRIKYYYNGKMHSTMIRNGSSIDKGIEEDVKRRGLDEK